ncbi:hypothetical protein KIH39_22530 [Telmatocola sphagniphila]|uniref:Uncharacterized protein n=1 Tax=Telmatocola sphagniphila TaxID=1123043 RepID=A0A8E6B3M9_9BACT|nr:hypothetical protein [Telmatocola sphagniphila]QVL31590.1 hypothetical protein KIH39_22530 [Telmatocola sphagniphila]
MTFWRAMPPTFTEIPMNQARAIKDAKPLSLLEPERMLEIAEKPFRLLPREVAGPAFELFSLFADKEKTALPLCASLSVWISRWGVDVEDMIKILHDATKPGVRADAKFPGSLVDYLATKVQLLIDERKREADRKRMRDKAAAEEAGATVKINLAEVLGGIGKSV